MRRYLDLDHTPHEARSYFASLLDGVRSEAHDDSSQNRGLLQDVTAVEFLRQARIETLVDEDTLRRRHRELQPLGSGRSNARAFDELVRVGLPSVSWGRVKWPLGVHTALRVSSNHRDASTLHQLLDYSDHDRATRTVVPDCSKIVAAFQRFGQSLPDDPGEIARAVFKMCRSPAWVLARLWDEPMNPADPVDDRLSRWVDAYSWAYWPNFLISEAWDRRDADAFRRAAWARLSLEVGLTDWEVWRSRFITQAAIRHHRLDTTLVGHAVPSPPSSLFNRWCWLRTPAIANDVQEACEGFGRILLVAQLLLVDVCRHHSVEQVRDELGRYLDLARDRPLLLIALESAAHRTPRLLAELVHLSGTAAWAVAQTAIVSRAGRAGLDPRCVTDAAESFGRLTRDAAEHAIHALLPEATQAGGALANLLRWLAEEAQSAGSSPRARDRHFGVLIDEIWQLLADWDDEQRRAPIRAAPAFAATCRHLADLLEAESHPVESATFSAAASAFLAGQKFAVDGCLRELSQALTAAYHQQLTIDPSVVISPSGCLALALASRQQGDDEWRRFLGAVDSVALARSLAALPEAKRYAALRDAAGRIRLHIGVLARAIVGWPGPVQTDLIWHLARFIRASARDDFNGGRLGAFDVGFEDRPSLGEDVGWVTLGEEVAVAAASLSPTEREPLLTASCEIDEPLALAKLVARLPSAETAALRAKLAAATPTATPTVIASMQRVEALLDAGLLADADRFFEGDALLVRAAPDPHVALWGFRLQLRRALATGDADAILSAALPGSLTSKKDQELARRTLDLFRGAALMSKEGRAAEAALHFRRLCHEHPNSPAFAVNLFAAIVAGCVTRSLDVRPTDLELNARRRALREGDLVLQRFAPLDQSTRAVYEHNRITLLLSLWDFRGVLRAIAELPPDLRTQSPFPAYEVVALLKLGRRDEARGLVKESLQAPGRDLTPGLNLLGTESADLKIALVDVVTEALVRFPSLEPHEQTQTMALTVREFLTDALRDACGQIDAFVPVLARKTFPGEDRITDLVVLLMQAQLQFYRWTVQARTPGGHSGRGDSSEHGGVGLPDVQVRKGTSLIALGEAVRGVTARALKQRYRRLFGYGSCEVMFVLVWSRAVRPVEVVNRLQAIVGTATPSAFPLKELIPLPRGRHDHGALGFTSRHENDRGKRFFVVHLVVDLRQAAQRFAATSARAPRAKGPAPRVGSRGSRSIKRPRKR